MGGLALGGGLRTGGQDTTISKDQEKLVRLRVAEELGHSRVSVTGAYYGSNRSVLAEASHPAQSTQSAAAQRVSAAVYEIRHPEDPTEAINKEPNLGGSSSSSGSAYQTTGDFAHDVPDDVKAPPAEGFRSHSDATPPPASKATFAETGTERAPEAEN